MVAPLPRPERREYRANWLGRYLKVENQYKDELRKALQDASIGIDNAFAKARFRETRTGAVQRQQMALAHREVRKEVKNLFGTTEDLIRGRKQDAAVAAVNAGLYDQRGLLRRIFSDPQDSRDYADSLRQTAIRNVEAVEARVLDSWFPLAESVWGTQNLALGRVDTVINSGLARGASARDIANDVQSLVNPDVPGGVSYAALRLGRTEINNAFHAQAIEDARDTPWIHEMRWNLSLVHKDDPGDECEDYEMIGTFPAGLVPDKPHPNCRCFVTPDLPGYEDFENSLLMGQYDEYLDGVMENTDWTSDEIGKPSGPRLSFTPEDQLKEIAFHPPDSQNARLMIDVPFDDDRFIYRQTKDEEHGKYKEWEIIPRKYPEKATFEKEFTYRGETQTRVNTVYYDPKVVTLTKDENEFVGYTQSIKENKLSEFDTPKGLLWRGMSREEYEISIKRGYFESLGESNVGGEAQAGKTYFSTNIDQAGNYATWFAQPEYKPTFDHPGYVIGIKDDPKLLREQGTEVGVPGRIPAKSVESLYEARPFIITPGSQGAQLDWSDNWVKGGSSQPNIQYYWREKGLGSLSIPLPPEPPLQEYGLSGRQPIPEANARNAAARARIEAAVPEPLHGGFYGITANTDPRTTEELATAVENLARKYPDAVMTRLGWDDLDPQTYGKTFTSDARTANGTPDEFGFVGPNGFYSRVQMNRQGSQNYDEWKILAEKDERSGWHTAGSAEKPIASTFNHEFGHVIVNSLGKDFDWVDDRITTRQVTATVKDVWKESGTDQPYKQWIKNQLSEYSFRDYVKGYLDKDETLAEAFDVVERNRGNAAENALWKLLTDRYWNRYGKP